MKKFEHKFISFYHANNPKDLETNPAIAARLTELSAEGWEAVGGFEAKFYGIILFKRELALDTVKDAGQFPKNRSWFDALGLDKLRRSK